jgi:hypothetical protein
VRSDVVADELFDLASLRLVEHGPKLARQASCERLVIHNTYVPRRGILARELGASSAGFRVRVRAAPLVGRA